MDRPGNDHLPDFRLYDPWVTENYLVKDIMNHKTGFQAQALDVIPALGYAETICTVCLAWSDLLMVLEKRMLIATRYIL